MFPLVYCSNFESARKTSSNDEECCPIRAQGTRSFVTNKNTLWNITMNQELCCSNVLVFRNEGNGAAQAD